MPTLGWDSNRFLVHIHGLPKSNRGSIIRHEGRRLRVIDREFERGMHKGYVHLCEVVA